MNMYQLYIYIYQHCLVLQAGHQQFGCNPRTREPGTSPASYEQSCGPNQSTVGQLKSIKH